MKIRLRHFLLALLLGVAVYAAAVFYSGYQTIRESLAAFRWSAFGFALALATLNYALRIARWQFYLRRLGIEGVGLLHGGLVFLSGFVLTVTPGKLGEVFKSAVLKRTHGVAIERTAPIVVAERLTDVIGVVTLVAVGSSAFSGGVYWAVAGCAATLLALAAIASKRFAHGALDRLRRSPRFGFLAPRIAEAYDNLRTLVAARALLVPVLLSIVGWGLEGVALHVLLAGFGWAVPVAFCVFFYAAATLAGALIPVPGGLGVTEAMLFEQLVLVAGVSAAVSTSSMVLVRLATLWWAVLVGFVALFVLRLLFPALAAPAAPTSPRAKSV